MILYHVSSSDTRKHQHQNYMDVGTYSHTHPQKKIPPPQNEGILHSLQFLINMDDAQYIHNYYAIFK